MQNPEINPRTDELIDELIASAEITHEKTLIKRLLETAVGLAEDNTERLNLKISSAALSEMREAFRLFAPFADDPKVTIFGSARTLGHDPLWSLANEVAAGLAQKGWLVITGAGPGIMEAAAVGAGPENALGVSIRLPFEEKPNDIVNEANRLVAMKYFFTRKLMLVKESLGFICLPGGFGTMDEVFELLTLQQTGKMVPVPIVLLDKPGGTYWQGFKNFVASELEDNGYVTKGDLDRVLITDSVDEAVAEVQSFWSNYHSIRWFNERLFIRLKKAPDHARLRELNESFADLILEGEIEKASPHPLEIKEGDALDMERITFVPAGREIGELHRLIRALN